MKKSYETPLMDILSLDMGGCVLNNASLQGSSPTGSSNMGLYSDYEDDDDCWN
jgi:hypothetical protein